jgi:alpha-galactosidase
VRGLRAFWVVLTLVLTALSAPAIKAETVVRAGYASIASDPDSATWTIGANGLSLTLLIDPAQDFQVMRLGYTLGEPQTIGTLPDTQVTLGGRRLPFGNRGAGWVFNNVATSVSGFTVQLDVTYDLPSSRLRATRHYAITSGSPTFETWTTFAPLSGAVVLSDLNAFVLSIPAGTMHWVNGLQGDDANVSRDAAFSLQQRNFAAGERMSLGAAGRSSEQTVPWFAVGRESDVFYAGLLWSGAWALTADRSAAGLNLSLGLAGMSTSITSVVDGPHAVFGVARGGIADASAALRTFIRRALRGGRSFDPLVTYNTWYAYGVAIDEESMRREIDGAAALGAELFMMDAGWYAGAGRGGPGDFTSGLGTWQVDRSRFPSGLRALRDYAHDRGLKFGIWVEPERVAQSTIGQPGLAQDMWLAKNNGKFGSIDSAQICLGGGAARQWIRDRLTTLIDTVQPDYLKWDNNLWVNCDRSGHVHAATDGNFAHVNGLYSILSDLRARYPDLLIENVSGGGNRMDLGMLRYSDVAWMDDRTTPSVKVRHNIQGLSALFPPAYLLSFAMHDQQEALHDGPDLPLLLRSRMSAVLGLCLKTGDLSENDAAAIVREIETYKALRGSLRTGAGSLLSGQASVDGPAWDVFQTTPEGDSHVLIWATQSDPAVSEVVVVPVGLRSRTLYEVRSIDSGLLGIVSGATLMADGVAVSAWPHSAAHLLVVTPVPAPRQ